MSEASLRLDGKGMGTEDNEYERVYTAKWENQLEAPKRLDGKGMGTNING